MLKTEIVLDRQKILIVTKKNYPFITLFKEYLKKYEGEVYLSPIIPKSIKQFNCCFFINEDINSILIKELSEKTKLIFIFFNQDKNTILNQKVSNIKIINIHGDAINSTDIDKILWFSFSSSKEKYLKLHTISPKKNLIKNERILTSKKILTKFFKPKRLVIFFTTLLIFFHIMFIFPFAISVFFTHQIFSNIKKGDFKNINYLLAKNQKFSHLTYNLYQIVRPTYLFFSIAIFPDNTVDALVKTHKVFEKGYESYLNVKEIEKLFLKKNKNDEEKKYLSLRIKKLKEAINSLQDNLNSINQKIPLGIPFFKEEKNLLIIANDSLIKLEKLLDYHDKIFGKNKLSKYLVFFANNRELRPGGGFLGSFGILEIKNYTLENIKIYDVYDADGQLKVHIEPPEPIRKYLKIPHWFLRDSNFSPDFFENYQQAKFFLEKEMNLKDFDGAILLTTSAVEKILDAIGTIYLPDFNENINRDNFYLKTQLYSEKNFFPGSIQKKNFLSSLTRQIIINADQISPISLFRAIKKSLDEKQMVVYFENESLQKFFDSWHWSGRLINPLCQNFTTNCLPDYLFFYDANVGINKANYYINRMATLKIRIDKDGDVFNNLTIQYKNDSPSEVFPGGIYRNYLQILLPKNAVLKTITKDGVLINQFDEDSGFDFLKKIGFFFEVPPKKIVLIKIDYQLPYKIKSGKQIYQLIVQKQIGSFNNDLILEFTLPSNISLINKNFIPLVNGENIIYNTNLDTDKIFFLELNKN